MGRALTNFTAFAYAKESTLGVLPGGPEWRTIEPNTVSEYGPEVIKVSRQPISKNRQRRKGTTTDLNSTVGIESDLTGNAFLDFIEGFCFSLFNGVSSTTAAARQFGFHPTAVTATGYTVAAGGALPNDTLVYASGFANAANNGLKVLAGTSTGTEIKAAGLVVEASTPGNAVVEVVGVRGAVGDIQIDASGHLISTILNFTTLDLIPGQEVWIGGDATANKFATAADRGFARIRIIAAGKLTLDKRPNAFTVDNGATKLIDLFFGRFVRNVAVDDADFSETSFQFEAAYKNLQDPGPGDEYEYAKGNYCNTMVWNLPLAGKATCTFGFVGTDTPAPTTVRATNAATPVAPLKTTLFNTSADIVRLRVQKVDESALTTDFKECTLTINNNVSPEKVLSVLGAKYMNAGEFDIDIAAKVLFTSSGVLGAIRNNDTVGMDFALRNTENGAIYVDVPSMMIGDGSKDFPQYETIQINLSGMAFQDTFFGHSLGVTYFAYVPAS